MFTNSLLFRKMFWNIALQKLHYCVLFPGFIMVACMQGFH